jgi:hypothetical protein
MDKLAYEFGITMAMVDAGLMEKQALMNPILRNTLIGAGLGGAGGAAAATEGNRLEGALLGAGAGGGAGLVGTAGVKGVSKLRGALKARANKKLLAAGDKILGINKPRPIGNAIAYAEALSKRVGKAAKKAPKATPKPKVKVDPKVEQGGYRGMVVGNPNTY